MLFAVYLNKLRTLPGLLRKTGKIKLPPTPISYFFIILNCKDPFPQCPFERSSRSFSRGTEPHQGGPPCWPVSLEPSAPNRRYRTQHPVDPVLGRAKRRSWERGRQKAAGEKISRAERGVRWLSLRAPRVPALRLRAPGGLCVPGAASLVGRAD